MAHERKDLDKMTKEDLAKMTEEDLEQIPIEFTHSPRA